MRFPVVNVVWSLFHEVVNRRQGREARVLVFRGGNTVNAGPNRSLQHLDCLLLEDGFCSVLRNRVRWIRQSIRRKRSLGFAHRFRPTYPEFLHGAPPTAACAAFIKESA